ncbi:MAG: hypothetical protein AAGK32_15660, partial [Actinomycetota bacterium]
CRVRGRVDRVRTWTFLGFGGEPDPRAPGPDTPVGETIVKGIDALPLPPDRPAHVLLMWSGGLDSVALLANLLAATDHEIHAHHIVLDNGERRAGAETRAVNDVLTWCRENLRPFDDSESGHTFPPGGGGGGWDTTLTMFTAARVTRSLPKWPVDVVVTGHIRTGFRELAEGEAVFHSTFQSRRRRRPDWIRPLARLTAPTQPERKADIAWSIPQALVDHSWWCRRPIEQGDDWDECGECHACKAMTEADQVLADRASAT